jgi:hypothetical protein
MEVSGFERKATGSMESVNTAAKTGLVKNRALLTL